MPCPCRAPDVPLPCRIAKDLDYVVPIWFKHCDRVWFTHASKPPVAVQTLFLAHLFVSEAVACNSFIYSLSKIHLFSLELKFCTRILPPNFLLHVSYIVSAFLPGLRFFSSFFLKKTRLAFLLGGIFWLSCKRHPIYLWIFMFTSLLLRCQIWDWLMKFIDVNVTKQSSNLISS